MRMTFVKVFIVLLLLHRTNCQIDGDLRVSGGENSREGRLEIYHNGAWGTVCDDGFDKLDAIVACRQLTKRNVKSASFYTAGGGTGPIWLDDLACTSTEWKLKICRHVGWYGENCAHSEDVGIRCSIDDSGGNDGWGSWNSWGGCSRTCGGGNRKRTRHCSNPSPSSGGDHCSGNQNQTERCGRSYCRVNGAWGPWNPWESCSRSCGNGYHKRIRYCNYPRPLYGGRYCSGDAYQIQHCLQSYCKVDGNWGEWSDWGPCNVTCGSGTQTRYRQCDDPSPYFGGITCAGLDSQIQPCNDSICQSDAETQYSVYVVVSASGGAAVGTLLLVVFGICASKISCSKRAKKEKPSGQHTEDMTEGTYRQSDNIEIYERPCHSTEDGMSDEGEYKALTCDNTITTSETVNNEAYGLQSVEEEEDQNVYENY